MAATCEKSEIGTETVADLLSQLRDFEDRYGVSTTVIMKQFEENPDSIDYAKIDFNSWYTLYLTMCEVVATDEGPPDRDEPNDSMKEGSSEPFFYFRAVAGL